ncbi:MAG TPA: HlyD family efflux transporter periplasmic adaptor subunit [Xanthomonadales bacterium]|nr:HlyD family efflux transporter periplasmic adaptor subunit [Xanthomonadales bacterium]
MNRDLPMKISRKWIAGVVGLLLLTALLVWAFAPKPVQVETATAALGRFESTISEDAKTRVRDRYTVFAPLAGRLARITLREGDDVEPRAVVANLTPVLPPMLDTRSIQELSARIEAADAAIQRAQTHVESARINVQKTRSVLKRSEELARSRYISALQLDTDRLAAHAAEKELSSAEQDRHVAGHELEQARAALSAASQANESGGENSFAVRSPVSGQVLRVLQPSATTVALGTPLLDIGDIHALELVAELLTTDALLIRPGTSVRIERWGGAHLLQGRVRRVEPSAFTKVSALGVEEQRVNVLIDITSPPAQWRALGDGFRVGVQLITLARDNVLTVPVSAVFPSPGGRPDTMSVFMVRDGLAQRVPVVVGARNGEQAWIKSGLKAGDKVIIYPGNTVDDGVRVKPRALKAAS